MRRIGLWRRGTGVLPIRLWNSRALLAPGMPVFRHSMRHGSGLIFRRSRTPRLKPARLGRGRSSLLGFGIPPNDQQRGRNGRAYQQYPDGGKLPIINGFGGHFLSLFLQAASSFRSASVSVSGSCAYRAYHVPFRDLFHVHALSRDLRPCHAIDGRHCPDFAVRTVLFLLPHPKTIAHCCFGCPAGSCVQKPNHPNDRSGPSDHFHSPRARAPCRHIQE